MVVSIVRRLQQFDALVVTALIWFLGKFVRYAFPPLFETLGESYSVSRTMLGTTFTGFMIVYAAMQLPSGLLADRLGGVRVLVAGSLLTIIGSLVLVVDSPFFVLAGAMAIMGAGTGTYKVVSVRLLSQTYPAQLGRVLGVFDTFGTFGGAAAPTAVVLAASLPPVFGASWRTLFLATAIASIGLSIAAAVRIPGSLDSESAPNGNKNERNSSNPDRNNESTSVWTYLTLFREWKFTAFVAVTILFGFAYNGVVAFLPLYLISETALSSVTANLLFSALFLVSLVQLVTGEASDRIGTVPILMLTLSVATAGLVAILALSDTGGPLLLGSAVIILGLGAHGYRPVRGAYLMEVVPDDVAGGSFGIVRTLLMGSGAVAPAVVGYLSETAGFRTAFELLAVSLIGASALMGLLWVVDW